MSANATRGDFALDYIAARPHPQMLGARLPMIAMMVLLLAALVAGIAQAGGGGASAPDDDMSAILQGP